MAIFLSGTSATEARDPLSFDDLDTLLDADPYLPIPANLKAFDPALGKIWTLALAAPEADVRRLAAESLGLATDLGMTGLEGSIEGLTRIAADTEEQPRVRLAAIRALVVLDARQSASTLEQCAETMGPDGVHLIYPALARWNHGPSRDVWLNRLNDPAIARSERHLAIIGLGEVRDGRAEEWLRATVVDAKAPSEIRIASAKALARIQTSSLLPVAKSLASDATEAGRAHRVLAALLLREHGGSEAESQLAAMAVDPEPAVANLALARLFELSVPRVGELAPHLLSSRDANCRRWATRAVSLLPSAAHCATLGPVLNDPHPEIRILSRDALIEFATKHELRDEVIRVAVDGLAGDDWRGIEQACRIVGTLDHKPAAARLVEVLERPRLEEKVSAAWALRKIVVPETLDPVFAYTQQVSRFTVGGERDKQNLDYNPVLTQLFQLFGLMDYRKSEPLLRRYLPKDLDIVEARAGAIWTLGHFHRDDPEPSLVEMLEQRLADTNSNPPEHDRVRQMCAVALGRMKARTTLPTLRKYYALNTPNSPCGYACGWAIEQLTGEPIKLPDQLYDLRQGWFLTPLK